MAHFVEIPTGGGKRKHDIRQRGRDRKTREVVESIGTPMPTNRDVYERLQNPRDHVLSALQEYHLKTGRDPIHELTEAGIRQAVEGGQSTLILGLLKKAMPDLQAIAMQVDSTSSEEEKEARLARTLELLEEDGDTHTADE